MYYRIVEKATQNGLQLLKDPIYVGTLPRVADSNSNITAYDVNGDGAVTSADVTLLATKVTTPSTAIATGSGDINGDGKITYEDAVLLQDFVNNYVDITPYDINNDGVVDNVDLTILTRYIARNSITLPEGKGDVNGDGTIAAKDRTALQKFILDYTKRNAASGDKPFNRRYNLSYKVQNSRVFEMPFTGSTGFAWVPFIIAGIGLLTGMTIIVRGGKKPQKKRRTA